MADGSTCGYIFLLTILKIASAALGIVFISLFAASTIPIAIFGGLTLARSKFDS